MKEHSILFSGPMVRAIVENLKSQTRRVIRQQIEGSNPYRPWPETHPTRWHWDDASFAKCPYGVAGDRLVPLCTWAVGRDHDEMKPTDLPHDVSIWSWWESAEKPGWCGKSRPGRFMPKFLRGWLPRLDNKNVRVERLQEISEADAEAEGCAPVQYVGGPNEKSYRDGFAIVWDQINKKRGHAWEANDWVWVVEFGGVS